MHFKFSTLFSVATYLVAAVSAAAVPELEERDSKFLLITFEKVKDTAVNGLISKRSGIYPNDLIRERLFYLTYVDVGSNKQRIGVDIDTGSADLWFPDVNAGGDHPPLAYGGYDPDSSSTSQNTGQSFYIQYVDRTHDLGYYYLDTVSLGDSPGATLENFQFADATTTDLAYGIFGIGRDGNEATYNVYPNFLDRLKSDGLIATKAYSIFLNDEGASQGTVIFGGKDLDKIDGPLVAQQIVDDANLAIKLDSVTVNGQTFQSGDNSVLDTGTTTAAFTRELGDAIFSHYDNARYNSYLKQWLVDSDKNVDQPVTFNFNGISITISLADAYDSNITTADGTEYGPGFDIISYDFNLLGDIFLRDAYVVYDYDANTVSIAKPKYTSSSNIVAL